MANKLIPIPTEWLPEVQYYIQGFPNETREFSSPHIRRSLIHVYPFFIVLYVLLGTVGILGNIFMARHIIHEGLYRQATFGYLLGLNICYTFMSTVVLPLSLAVLLVHNWIFSSCLCFAMPMLQDMPFYVSVLTLLLLSINRYRQAIDPNSNNSPRPLGSSLAVWILSFGSVLPYAFYMKYLDLEVYFGKPFEGVGICSVWIIGTFSLYIRSLCILLYGFPVIFITIFHTKTGRIIKAAWQDHHIDKTWSSRESERRASSALRLDSPVEVISVPVPNIRRASHLPLSVDTTPTPSSSHDQEGPRGSFCRTLQAMNLKEDRRCQRYLGLMALVIGLSLCPLTILRLVKHFSLETEYNSFLFDVTYITFVWIAFLPTASTPLLYCAWKCSRNIKDRIESLFCFKRRRTESIQISQEMTQELFPSSARAAHRLSLEPITIPRHARLSVPDARLGVPPIWTPILSRTDKQFQRPRVHSFNT